MKKKELLGSTIICLTCLLLIFCPHVFASALFGPQEIKIEKKRFKERFEFSVDNPAVGKIVIEKKPGSIIKGKVRVNRQDIKLKKALKDTDTYEQEISLQSHNVLFVKIKGSPGDFITISVLALPPPLISLEILSPINGDRVSRPNVLVRGRFVNRAGNETGITINGIPAMIHGDQFAANHVPLAEGGNAIKILASDSAGNTASETINVSAAVSGPYVLLTPEPESGVTPLTSRLRVQGEGVAISTASMSWVGPGEARIEGAGGTEYRAEMDAEGIYIFTTQAEDAKGAAYMDAVAVLAMNEGDVAELLRRKWTAFLSTLESGDVEASLQYFARPNRPQLEELFNAMGARIVQMYSREIEPKEIRNTRAVFRVKVTTSKHGSVDTDVVFIREEGQWRLWDLR